MRQNLFRSTLSPPPPRFIITTASYTYFPDDGLHFSRGIPSGSVLARELREYNNSRGWSYLLARNSAAKNRPHRGVNINASLGGKRRETVSRGEGRGKGGESWRMTGVEEGWSAE